MNRRLDGADGDAAAGAAGSRDALEMRSAGFWRKRDGMMRTIMVLCKCEEVPGRA